MWVTPNCIPDTVCVNHLSLPLSPPPSFQLTMALTTLSFSLSNLTGVGHSLDSARSLHQQASEITSQLAGVGGDVDGFSIEVEDCITRKHYQATHLSKLARSLQDKKGLVSKSATERQRLVSASVEFQQNIKNVSSCLLIVFLDTW